MTRQAAFWDSSALVPLCVLEANSRRVHAELRKFEPVVWWGTPIEIHSAIAREHRLGQLSDGEKQKALAQLEILVRGSKEILPGDPVRDLARQLLDVHDLRAADRLQLAAALVWCQKRPARRNFLSADRRLSDAARAQGFLVVDLS
jgi:predicted nucleic acid-binding protein